MNNIAIQAIKTGGIEFEISHRKRDSGGITEIGKVFVNGCLHNGLTQEVSSQILTI